MHLLDAKEECERLTKEIDELQLSISYKEGKELHYLSMRELMQLEGRMKNTLRLVKEKQRELQQEHCANIRGHNELTIEKMIGELQRTLDSHFSNQAGEHNGFHEQRKSSDAANQKKVLISSMIYFV